jgi:SpoVK/Ycf46/Vps4 family AAA+-type ATPase
MVTYTARIPVMFPDADARAEILRIHLNVRRVVPNDIKDFTPIVEKTNLFSGAELEELTKRAARHAFKEGAERVTLNHLLDALNSFNIDAKARKEQLDKYIALSEKFCDDKQYLQRVNAESKDVYDKAKMVADEIAG